MNLRLSRSILCAAAIALLALLYPSTAHTAGWAFISVKSTIGSQPGAKGNGIDDDTAAINRAINALNSSTATTVYFPPGTYRYIGQMPLVPLANRSYRFYGDGPGVSIIQFEGSSAGINVPSLAHKTLNVEGLTLKAMTPNCGTAINASFGPHCPNPPDCANTKFHTATIHNVQIMGSATNEDTPGYWTSGIRLYRGQNSVIDNVEISGRKDLTQTGIVFDNEASGENSTGYQVSNIAVKWCNAGLVMNGYLEGLYMTGFNFFSCGRVGLPSISLNGAPGTVSGVFQLVNGLVDTVGSGLSMSNFEYAKVSNVSFKHNPGSAVPPYSWSTLLHIQNITRAVVSECSFYGTSIDGPLENGIFPENSTAVQISGNHFANMQSQNAGSAILVRNSSLVRITDNLFTEVRSHYDVQALDETYYCGNYPTNKCGSEP